MSTPERTRAAPADTRGMRTPPKVASTTSKIAGKKRKTRDTEKAWDADACELRAGLLVRGSASKTYWAVPPHDVHEMDEDDGRSVGSFVHIVTHCEWLTRFALNLAASGRPLSFSTVVAFLRGRIMHARAAGREE